MSYFPARCTDALAAPTTLSTVNPNCCCSAFSGADAPNVRMPMTDPAAPT